MHFEKKNLKKILKMVPKLNAEIQIGHQCDKDLLKLKKVLCSKW